MVICSIIYCTFLHKGRTIFLTIINFSLLPIGLWKVYCLFKDSEETELCQITCYIQEHPHKALKNKRALPFGGIKSQRPWVVQVLPHKDLPVLSIQAGNFDAIGSSICPVEVLPHPVHSHSFRIIQPKLNHMFNRAPIHESSAYGLENNGIKILQCFISPQ